MESLKDKDLTVLVKELQGPGGILDQLNHIIYDFEKMHFNEINSSVLNDSLVLFQTKVFEISCYYEAFFSKFIMSKSLQDKNHIKPFLDYCQVFISKINNKYISPISYRINQIKNEDSIKVGRSSIKIGIWSIIVGVISILVGVIITLIPKDDNRFIYNELKNSSITDNIIHSSIINLKTQIDLDYIKSDKKIDSLYDISKKYFQNFKQRANSKTH